MLTTTGFCRAALACWLVRRSAKMPRLKAQSLLSLACQVAGQMPVLTLPGNANAWRHHQGEIVNILLKIKNSFLPTKQILIGL
ncbi:hypothetical protein [Aeromonas hydrophila]|uniref:Transposase n=1 Tax=Aeromonas hydrophila TaxID=644 RepID=A0AAX3PCX1_AERHY|nr:hypothetical protein [Aeromonas hydrophila]WEE29259.1 hypothetical protein PY771_25360 [Aeromonas hydrophila]